MGEGKCTIYASDRVMETGERATEGGGVQWTKMFDIALPFVQPVRVSDIAV